MNLFLLGATGKTGSEIMRLALARGHEVTAFVRSPQKLSPAGALTIVRGDPHSPKSMAAASPATTRCCPPSGRIPGRRCALARW